MNRTSSHTRSLQTRLSHRIGLLIVAGSWLLAGASKGDEPPKGPPPGPVLNLSDGGFVPGTLGAFGRPGVFRWKSDPFTSPFEFAVGEVQSIRFPAADKLARPVGAFGFELSGGDVLFGSVVGLDDKAAELDVARLGRLRVDRSRVRRIFRWRDGADLVYNGPNGLTGWREFTPAKARPQPQQAVRAAQPAMRVAVAGMVPFGANAVAPQPAPPAAPATPPGPAWLEEGGQLTASRDGATIQSDIGLPARASIELDLSWKQSPDFLIALGVSDDEQTVARAFRFEVWEGQLVVLRELDKEGDLASIQPVGKGPGRVQLQLFLDQELGKLLVFSASGELMADLKLGGQPGPGLPGVRLTNIRGDLRLERLRVGRWDGETPRPLGVDPSRIQLTDQSTVRGQVDRFDATSREFVVRGESGESRIAEDRVSNVHFSSPEEGPARTVRVLYQDGTRLAGEWVNVEEGALILTSPGVAGSLRAPLEGLRSLDVLRPNKESRDNEDPTPAGTLEMDGLRMRGRLVDSGGHPGGSGLVWQPLAGETASPIRPGTSGRINYRTPSPKTAQATPHAPVQRLVVNGVVNAMQSTTVRGSAPPATSNRRSLYLRTGDIIPVDVTQIDANGVWFRTDFSESKFVPNARIKAVEMATETGASIRVNKAKFERLLTLPRMQRDSPPTHLIRSRNGDILRGRVIGMDDRTIRLEIRLEEKEVPRDRVSRIIWLHADETDPSKKPPETPEEAKAIRVQAVRSDGIRMTFNAESFADGTLSGKSDVLGVCKVRVKELDQLLIGGSVEKEATQLAYQNWKLSNAPEPKSASDDDGGLSNGTESALVGKQAPDFQLDLLGGKTFHLADSKGKIVVLDFWASWCGPCIQTMPQVERVAREFADKGVELIAVNQQETVAQITAMLERQKLSMTVALDRDGLVSDKYEADAIPQTVIIDREGKVARLYVGGGPKFGDQLREALQALMPEAKP